MLNVHWALRKASLYFTLALAATVESLVTDVRYTVLIYFPINVQRSKGLHCFHRVVGLVVNICQWAVAILKAAAIQNGPIPNILTFVECRVFKGTALRQRLS